MNRWKMEQSEADIHVVVSRIPFQPLSVSASSLQLARGRRRWVLHLHPKHGPWLGFVRASYLEETSALPQNKPAVALC